MEGYFMNDFFFFHHYVPTHLFTPIIVLWKSVEEEEKRTDSREYEKQV